MFIVAESQLMLQKLSQPLSTVTVTQPKAGKFLVELRLIFEMVMGIFLCFYLNTDKLFQQVCQFV